MISGWTYPRLASQGSPFKCASHGYQSLAYDSANNVLYIGGCGVAKWDGKQFTVLAYADSAVNTLAWDSSSNTLYAGGAFNTIAGQYIPYLAKWNGTTWSSVGSGVNGAVWDTFVEPVSRKLYASGSFATAGGTTVNKVAKWNSGSWSALGATAGVSGGWQGVTSLAYDSASSSLYAGGDFTSAGGVASTKGIAKWNGSAWSALGTGAAWMFGGVYAAATDSTSALYIGGSFTGAGGVANTRAIAKWSGGAWSSIATIAPNNYVYALVVDPSTNNVYAGGSFTTVNGVSANYIAKWNGTSWTALGSGMNGNVTALAWDSSTNTLYAGGKFTTADGIGANRIAKWNGTTWSALGAGADLPVNALAFQGAQKIVAVGGEFNALDSVIRPILALFFTLTSTWM